MIKIKSLLNIQNNYKIFIHRLKEEFKGYDLLTLKMDAMSGLTVTAVALPLALAFGISSGATAQSGLITAIIAGLLIGGLGGSSFQISGPTGAMAAILMPLAARYGLDRESCVGYTVACNYGFYFRDRAYYYYRANR